MSTRTVHDCDRCGAKGITPIPLSILTGRSCDPSGNGSTNDYDNFDLCHKCTVAILGELLKPLSYEAGSALSARIKAFPRK